MVCWLRNSHKNQCDFVEVRFKNDRKDSITILIPSLRIGSVIIVEANTGHDTGVVSLTGELVRVQMKKKEFSRRTNLENISNCNTKRYWNLKIAREREEDVKLQEKSPKDWTLKWK